MKINFRVVDSSWQLLAGVVDHNDNMGSRTDHRSPAGSIDLGGKITGNVGPLDPALGRQRESNQSGDGVLWQEDGVDPRAVRLMEGRQNSRFHLGYATFRLHSAGMLFLRHCLALSAGGGGLNAPRDAHLAMWIYRTYCPTLRSVRALGSVIITVGGFSMCFEMNNGETQDRGIH